MLKIMTSVVPALILSLAAFSAGAAQLPASLMPVSLWLMPLTFW